jgi:DNA-binding PadR family transcriptional regulator
MSYTPMQIATQWRQQMQKGYLKIATLFVLKRGPLHGYEIIKHIKKWTLGLICPTAGGLYPTLKELEKGNLIEGEWIPDKRKKVYHITYKGRSVFREAVEKHFQLASSIRGWFLQELADLEIVEKIDIPLAIEPYVKVLLLKEDASVEERVEALKQLGTRLQNLVNMLKRMIDQINLREKKLLISGSIAKD